eukprot:3274723-Prymnesium_polylepis.1
MRVKPPLSGACDGRFVVCMPCCERSGLLGLWGCGLVFSPVIVLVRCLRAVNKVESSRASSERGSARRRTAGLETSEMVTWAMGDAVGT